MKQNENMSEWSTVERKQKQTPFEQEQKHFSPKLDGWRPVEWTGVKAGDHFRYSCVDYLDPSKRKLVYAVCHYVEGSTIRATAYKPLSNWENLYWNLNTEDEKKAFLFYKKNKT